MYRRSFAGWLVGAGGLTAGCLAPDATGPRTPPRSPAGGASDGRSFYIGTFEPVEADGGILGVRITVRNETDEQREGTVVIEIRTGDDRTTAERSVSVPAASTRELTVETGVEYERWAEDGGISPRLK